MKISNFVSLAVAAAAFVPSFATAAVNGTISVLTNNVYFMSETLYPNWGQRTRAQLIVDSDYIKNHDVIVIEECWDSDPCGILKAGLLSQCKYSHNPYQTPTVGQTKTGWDSTSGSYSSTSIENGGVVILSKWPITLKKQFIYKSACGADWFANKGFAYVVIDYQGTNIHVFGTHLQSDDPACTSGQAASYRGAAVDSWRSFIDSANIPADELVIMAGDFNTLRDSAEFSSMLTRLDANQPTTYNGYQWTWDPLTNEIAHYNYPNDAPEYIDYVFTDKKHKAVKSAVQTSLYVKSSEYILKSVAYHEYSDHYPVQTVIEVDL